MTISVTNTGAASVVELLQKTREAAKKAEQDKTDPLARKDSILSERLKRNREALTMLQNAAQTKKKRRQENKAQAKEKVARLKKQIEALQRCALAMDPKALAKKIKSLARELAAAVKQYGDSGGGLEIGTGTAGGNALGVSEGEATIGVAETAGAEAVAGDEVPSGEETAASANTASAEAAAREAEAEAAAAEEEDEKGGALAEKEDDSSAATNREALADTWRAIAAEAQQSASEKFEDQYFRNEVRLLSAKLKSLLQMAKQRLEQEKKDEDAKEADKALEEVERELGSMGVDNMAALDLSMMSIGAMLDQQI